METGEAGLELIKKYEGFQSAPYLCPAGIPTIGYGSTWDADGKPITMRHKPVSESEGEDLLLREVSHVEHSLRRLITVDLIQGQYDALVSFTYNLGTGNLQASTLRRKINRSEFEDAAEEFPKWRKAGGRVLAGLVRRRAEEQALFLGNT